MENDSLEELKTLIEEEIYLIPADRELILSQLQRRSSVKKPMEAPAVETVPDPIPVRGDFSKGVLILHEEDTLQPEVMEMLVKMIKACGHSMTEVGMVASSILENRSMAELQNLNAHIILKFGRIKHPINALSSARYEVFSENETEYLFADSLSEISEDKVLKVKLWTSLQVLFNLSPKK